MKKNIGTTDRIVRVSVGLAVVSLVFVGPQTAWGLLGIIPLATGIFGFCALYKLIGLETTSDKG